MRCFYIVHATAYELSVINCRVCPIAQLSLGALVQDLVVAGLHRLAFAVLKVRQLHLCES